MKIRYAFLASAVVALLALHSSAQTFDVPADVSYKSKDDYAAHEKDVIAAAKWLEATPVGEQKEKRQLTHAFVMQWLTGSPTITMEVGSFTVNLTKDNPELLGMYIAGYCRYALENNHSADKLKANTAAAKSVINLFGLGGDFKKNKTLQKAVEKDKEGALEEWVKNNLK